ncbi:MAG: xanthan lyase, partial [Bacteroidales bacterium]|nr:xanthan lyase [Bacteroidales bacterium]
MKKQIIFSALLLLLADISLQGQTIKEVFKPMGDSVNTYMSGRTTVAPISVDTVKISKRRLYIYFSQSLSDNPLRDNDVKAIYGIAKALMPERYARYSGNFRIYVANKRPLEDLADCYLSGKKNPKIHKEHGGTPITTDESAPYEVTKGLDGRNIALWQSHGYYYEQSLKRWEWQRARLFMTVEDLYTQSYVLPFLVPMLENAGAKVFLPRERDVNTNEVVVDNDSDNGYSEDDGDRTWTTPSAVGFANPKACYLEGENPFRMGTCREAHTVKGSRGRRSFAYWIPDIPEEGDYAVYVSYQTEPKSTEKAQYTVMYAGGTTLFSVNQRIGSGMWVYLGTFHFDKGRLADQGVMLSNEGKNGSEVVTADAVKFGGGMGNIARKPATVDENGNVRKIDYDVEPEISHYPRFTEGARYWLQWSGFDEDVYSPNMNQNDYTDDYQSRGIWVNALNNGSVNNPKGEEPKQAKKIPIDLSLAFHSDAGTTLTDSIVGTLAIYTRVSNGKVKYPDGFDRGTARDYCDIVQTQIVNDIKAQFEPEWNRRGLWDRLYAESRCPEVPAMLLELLSHENFADMRYGMDPSFRFTVSRAIYKGMLKYLSYRYGTDYVVAPLPVKSFSAKLEGDTCVFLSWNAVDDTLEPTAKAEKYIVYKRVDNGGFDNGRIVEGPGTEDRIVPGHIFSYKVEALNAGGKSFPSEIMSVGVPYGRVRGTVLIINGFDRVSAPASFASPDSTRAGFDFLTDTGVPYIRNINMIGEQHEYRRNIPWMDDDAPGFGASYGDLETKVIAGNTFDFTKIHGAAFMKKGYAFCSSSRDAVTEGKVAMGIYRTVDIIFGKQVTTQIGRDGSNPLRY